MIDAELLDQNMNWKRIFFFIFFLHKKEQNFKFLEEYKSNFALIIEDTPGIKSVVAIIGSISIQILYQSSRNSKDSVKIKKRGVKI